MRCEGCGSEGKDNFRLDDDTGYWMCQRCGTRAEHEVLETSEEAERATPNARIIVRSVRIGSEASRKRERILRTAEAMRKRVTRVGGYFHCLQNVLRAQIAALHEYMPLPASFARLVRALWFAYLRTRPRLLPDLQIFGQIDDNLPLDFGRRPKRGRKGADSTTARPAELDESDTSDSGEDSAAAAAASAPEPSLESQAVGGVDTRAYYSENDLRPQPTQQPTVEKPVASANNWESDFLSLLGPTEADPTPSQVVAVQSDLLAAAQQSQVEISQPTPSHPNFDEDSESENAPPKEDAFASTNWEDMFLETVTPGTPSLPLVHPNFPAPSSFTLDHPPEPSQVDSGAAVDWDQEFNLTMTPSLNTVRMGGEVAAEDDHGLEEDPLASANSHEFSADRFQQQFERIVRDVYRSERGVLDEFGRPAPSGRTEDRGLPYLSVTLAILYLALLMLGKPVSSGELLRMVHSNRLPYWSAWKSVPESRLFPKRVLMFTRSRSPDDYLPTGHYLEAMTRTICHRVLQDRPPPVPADRLLAQWGRELALPDPLMLFSRRLLTLFLSHGLIQPDQLRPGFGPTLEPQRNYVLQSPYEFVAAFIPLSIRLVYSLPPNSIPSSLYSTASGAVDENAILPSQAEIFGTGVFGEPAGGMERPLDVLAMTDGQLDALVQYCSQHVEQAISPGKPAATMSVLVSATRVAEETLSLTTERSEQASWAAESAVRASWLAPQWRPDEALRRQPTFTPLPAQFRTMHSAGYLRLVHRLSVVVGITLHQLHAAVHYLESSLRRNAPSGT